MCPDISPATGAFISPHVVSLNERISVCGTPISDQELAELADDVGPWRRGAGAR